MSFSPGQGSGGAGVTEAFAVVSLSDALTSERLIAGTSNQITITDGGANGNLTWSTPQDIHSGATPTFTGLSAASDDSGPLGASGTAFADLFLASGSVINRDGGDVTETHSANTLTWAGATSGYIFTDGKLRVGDSAAGITSDWEFTKDDNSEIRAIFENATSGTAGEIAIYLRAAGRDATWEVSSTGFTDSGARKKNQMMLNASTNLVNGLLLAVITGAPFEWAKNNTVIWSMAGSGDHLTNTAGVDIDMSAGGRIHGAGIQFNNQTLAADTNLTLDENDALVAVTLGSSSDNTITLPACSGNEGMVVKVYVVDGAGTNNAVVTRAGSDTIVNGSGDVGNTTVTLGDTADFVFLMCVSSSVWNIVHESGTTVA